MPFLDNTEDIGKDDRLDIKKVRLREDFFFFFLWGMFAIWGIATLTYGGKMSCLFFVCFFNLEAAVR